MDLLLICVRGGLALVFIAAAVGKLLDPEGSRHALREFSVPERMIAPGALALPLAELAVAAGLLAQPSAQIAAVGAIALLGAFSLGIANALRSGREPDCHCFGQLHSAPAGRGALARNAALALAAALVLSQGAGDALEASEGTVTAFVAAAALAFALAVATFTLLRENRRLRADAPATGRQQHLAVGTPAPALRLRDSHDAVIQITDVVATDRPTALVFVAPGCGPCDYLIPHIGRWRSVLADGVEVVLVSGLPTPDGPSAAVAAREPTVLWDIDEKAPETYLLNASPAALLVDPAGTIASSPAFGSEAIEALLRVAQRRSYANAQPSVAA